MQSPFSSAPSTTSECCACCHLLLKDPHIRCQDCESTSKTAKICTDCFARGREFGSHLAHHRYTVVKSDFSLLEPDWTAEEEKQLLTSLLHRGVGNWEDIAKVLVNKTPEQCRDHFERVYVENTSGDFADDWKLEEGNSAGARRSDQPMALVTPFEFPPRPTPGTQVCKELAGYNAARADFDVESDNLAELDMCAIDYDRVSSVLGKSAEEEAPPDIGSGADETLLSLLDSAAVDVYENRLRRRRQKKRVVWELGLLNRTRVANRPSQYHRLFSSNKSYEKLFKFSRLMCSMDFDYMMEGLQYESELKHKVIKMQDFRHNGLEKFAWTDFFERLKKRRETEFREVPTDTVRDFVCAASAVGGSPSAMLGTYVADEVTGKLVPESISTSSSALNDNGVAGGGYGGYGGIVGGRRQTAGPLDIVGYPGYEKLSSVERTLCSDVRVYPELYLDVKESLMAESERCGGLRLAEARRVVKIDVNKTRKLYDFFMAQQLISKPLTPPPSGNGNK